MSRSIQASGFLTAFSIACSLHAQEPPVGSTPLDELLATPISTAARYEQKLSDTAAAVTVITAEEIARYGWETLADALDVVRGLYLSYDRNYAFLGIRGFSRPSDYNNRLLVMIDGHSTNEHVFGSSAIGSDLALDLAEVERIEFVRGPGSVLYGSGAMFGVINVITRKDDSADLLRAELSVGSAGRRGASLAYGRSFGATHMRVAVNRRSIEGIDLRYPEYEGTGGIDGVARDLDYDDVFGLKGSVTRGNLSVNGLFSHRRKGIPTGAFGTTFGALSETLDERGFLDVSYSPRLTARSQLEVRAFVDSYRYFGEYAYKKVLKDSVNATFAGTEIRTVLDLRSNHRTTLGAQFIDELRMEYGVIGRPGRTQADTDIFSVYAQHEYQPLENLTIAAGARYDHLAGYGGRTTPRLAVVYHPGPSAALKALYGEAFRTPTPWERDYEDIDFGTIGNRDLEDESIRTSEIAWEQRLSPEILAVFSAYHYSVRNLIEQHEHEELEEVQFHNLGAISSRGVEMELNYRSSAGFWTFVNMTVQKAIDEAERLSNSPNHLVSAGASGPLLPRLTAAVEVVYESARRTVVGTRTDPFAIANITLSARLRGGLKLIAQMQNATDSRYAYPGGLEHRQPAIEQDGRTVLVRLVYQQ